LIWAIVNPLITIVVYWFVFEFGLRARSPIAHTPFVIWFITGIVPWLFFSDAWGSGTGCLVEYAYLVKKVSFKVSALPMVKILSSSFIHIVFVAIILIFLTYYGFAPSVYYLQFIYYTFCIFALATALSWITSAILPFFKDVGQLVGIFLQFGMWLTPIAWPSTMLPSRLRVLFKLNPMYYVIEGYRDSFIRHVWFYNRYNQTLYFWCLVVVLSVIGAFIFRKMRPHFADVL